MQFLGDTLETFSTEELDQLAVIALNGRQIKNVVRTAYLLTEDEEKLDYDLIQIVLRLRGMGL